MEEMWMKQQYEKINGAATLDAMMQQKIQFEALICSEKCKNEVHGNVNGESAIF